MSDILDRPTNKGYATVFGGQSQIIKDKHLPYKATEVNRIMDPAGAYIAKDAISKTDPLPGPVLDEPPTMPDVDDLAVRRARRRRIIMAQQQGGRASTILTDTNDGKLGG